MQSIRLLQDGQKLHQRGKHQEALLKYKLALKSDPKLPAAWIFKALVLMEQGKLNEAVQDAEQAFSLMKKPDLLVLINYGIILKNAGRFDEAAQAYEKALEINQNNLSAKANLGTIYLVQGRLNDAEEIFHQLAGVMEDPAPWLNLARIGFLKGQYDQISHYLDRAEDYDSTHPDCYMLRGRLALHEEDHEAAYSYAISSIKRSPANRDSWSLLQGVDSNFFELEDLNSILNKLSEVKVQSTAVLSIAVDLCRKHWVWGPLLKLEEMLSIALLGKIDKPPTASDVFTLLGANISQKAHLAAAQKCWDAITKAAPRGAVQTYQKSTKNKLRVGIMSSDLRGHAIGYLVVGLFESLPRKNIEWWAYNNAYSDDSGTRNRLRDNFDRFVNVSKLEDHELSERIKRDDIDVLIDLNQMTSGTRSAVFAYRPAPVQIQWLGMPGTLGAGNDVDYIIVDPWVVDDKNSDGFSECLLMLPRSYQPNDHLKPNLGLCLNRADAGLPQDAVVFGVFNQYYKFSPDTVLLWGKIFKEVPNAILWLLNPKNNEQKKQILSVLGLHGISEERVFFAEHKPQEEHLARLQWMDLVLDTWPYNAHTTCSDALRAGVPVLTLPQETFASRVAEGILNTAGLSEWVARSPEDYVDIAIKYGLKSRSEIDAIKVATNNRYWGSEMVNNKALGVLFERMLIGLHERAQRGARPTSLSVCSDGQLEPLHFGRQDVVEVNDYPASDKNLVCESAIPGDESDDPLVVDPSERLTKPWVSELKKTGSQARIANMKALQKFVMEITNPPLMLDIGAAQTGLIGHEILADSGLINVLGFEPDPKSFEKLSSTENSNFVNYALGDGEVHNLKICAQFGMNSFLDPKMDSLSMFPAFAKWSTVNSKMLVQTKRLDEVSEARNARFVKIDVQGAEKMILENGLSVLNGLSLLQIECSPIPLYHDEPSFFEIGLWLEKQGFVLHTLSNEDKRYFKPYGTEENPYSGKNHLFQVDAVFMPNPLTWVNMEDERLKCLAFFSHAMYRSYDLSMKALDVLDSRDNGSRVSDYKLYLDAAGLAA